MQKLTLLFAIGLFCLFQSCSKEKTDNLILADKQLSMAELGMNTQASLDENKANDEILKGALTGGCDCEYQVLRFPQTIILGQTPYGYTRTLETFLLCEGGECPAFYGGYDFSTEECGNLESPCEEGPVDDWKNLFYPDGGDYGYEPAWVPFDCSIPKSSTITYSYFGGRDWSENCTDFVADEGEVWIRFRCKNTDGPSERRCNNTSSTSSIIKVPVTDGAGDGAISLSLGEICGCDFVMDSPYHD